MAVNLGATIPPPSRGASATAKSGRKPSAATQQKRAQTADAIHAERAEGITGLFQLSAGILMFAGQPADGAAIAKHGEIIADETAKLAQKNAQVAQLADFLCQVGPYAGILTATIPLVLQILVNHDRIPVEAVANMGVVTPDTLMLELQAKAQEAQAEAAEREAEARKRAEDAIKRTEEAKKAEAA